MNYEERVTALADKMAETFREDGREIKQMTIVEQEVIYYTVRPLAVIALEEMAKEADKAYQSGHVNFINKEWQTVEEYLQSAGLTPNP